MSSNAPAANNAPSLSAATVRRSEWIKSLSLRSTKVLLTTAFGFAALLGPIQTVGQVVSDEPMPATSAADFAVSLAFSGVSSAAIAVGVLGVLLVTNEYTSGQLRNTLVAVPRRTLLVWGKAAVTAATVAATAGAAAAVAVLAAVRILAAGDLASSLSLGVSTRVVLGAAAYLVTWSLLGQALAWLTRSALGAVMALLGLMFVAPALIGIVPGLGPAITRWLPSEVALALMRVDPADGGPGLAVAAAATGVYAVVALAMAAASLSRRDVGGGTS
jgi:hypothetical protein